MVLPVWSTAPLQHFSMQQNLIDAGAKEIYVLVQHEQRY